MAISKKTTLGIFAAGAGVGAAVALLFAPRSGKQTRRRIKNSATDAWNRLEDAQEDIRSYMTEWVDEASGAIAAGIASGKDTAKEGGERVVRALENVREYVEDGKRRVEQYVKKVAG